jgi:hypothetical protein
MSDLDRVLGRRVPIQEVTTASAIPVVATVPSSRHAKRAAMADDVERKKKHARLISGVIGMRESDDVESTSNEDSLIPKDAEESDGTERSAQGINVKTPKFKKDDPDSPKDEQEQLLSPKAALVAPDVTPHSMTEIDPSDVPGPSATTFRAADAAEPPPAASTPVSIGQEDRFVNTMDTILGRDRSNPAPPAASRPPTPTMESSATAISPEAAAAMFSSGAIDPLKQGQPMPDPVVTDAKQVCEAFRRFC